MTQQTQPALDDTQPNKPVSTTKKKAGNQWWIIVLILAAFILGSLLIGWNPITVMGGLSIGLFFGFVFAALIIADQPRHRHRLIDHIRNGLEVVGLIWVLSGIVSVLGWNSTLSWAWLIIGGLIGLIGTLYTGDIFKLFSNLLSA